MMRPFCSSSTAYLSQGFRNAHRFKRLDLVSNGNKLPVIRGRLCRMPSQIVPRSKRITKFCTQSIPKANLPVPAQSDKHVAYWLFSMGGMVFVMVVLGGVTRLTRSGLSMVDWKPLGRRLPSTEDAWEKEFEQYKLYPEYKMVNQGITLDDFKFIYFMEWFHRMWGRAMGAVYLLPLAYFGLRKQIPRRAVPFIASAYLLGGTQGLIGWWMVKSGLEQKRSEDMSVPRVSPYRLATHLGFAFATLSTLVWGGLTALRPRASPVSTIESWRAIRALRLPVLAVSTATAITVASGAFVAGNDAGHAYNDWPFMAGKIVPEEIWMDRLGIRNFFENTATVQFDHRMLAYTTLATVGALTVAARSGGRWKVLPDRIKKPITALGHMVTLQATLGISTLLFYVPVPVAAAHQGGSVILWSISLWLLHSMRQALNAGIVRTGQNAASTSSRVMKASSSGGAFKSSGPSYFTTNNISTGVTQTFPYRPIENVRSSIVKPQK